MPFICGLLPFGFGVLNVIELQIQLIGVFVGSAAKRFDPLQQDLDKFIDEYNNVRIHQGKRCQGKTPMETFIDGKRIYDEKDLDEHLAA